MHITRVEAQFDHNDPKYRCCCRSLHVKVSEKRFIVHNTKIIIYKNLYKKNKNVLYLYLVIHSYSTDTIHCNVTYYVLCFINLSAQYYCCFGTNTYVLSYMNNS